MKINRQTLGKNIKKCFSEDVDFSNVSFSLQHVKAINKCHVDVEATQFNDLLRLNLKVEAEVVGVCSYTLEDVILNIKGYDELDFTDEDNGEAYYEPNNIFDLDPYILSIIFDKVPIKIVKKGAKLPNNGEGYRVISEDDLAKERTGNHFFDGLDDFESED